MRTSHFAVCLAFAACSGTPGIDSGTPDSGEDAGVVDSGTPDAGAIGLDVRFKLVGAPIAGVDVFDVGGGVKTAQLGTVGVPAALQYQAVEDVAFFVPEVATGGYQWEVALAEGPMDQLFTEATNQLAKNRVLAAMRIYDYGSGPQYDYLAIGNLPDAGGEPITSVGLQVVTDAGALAANVVTWGAQKDVVTAITTYDGGIYCAVAGGSQAVTAQAAIVDPSALEGQVKSMAAAGYVLTAIAFDGARWIVVGSKNPANPGATYEAAVTFGLPDGGFDAGSLTGNAQMVGSYLFPDFSQIRVYEK